jgi:tRNA pseudouridine32 synthase/23S rRNA pseudouridine746 synthase
VAAPAITYFDPPPPASSLPTTLASPFDPAAPHPLARRAADALLAELRRRPGLADLDAPGGGKMFGVLVVAAPSGRIGYLRGFSGMLDGAWHLPGFVPPLFDAAARDAFWLDGQRRLAELDHALRALDASPATAALRAAHAALAARHAAERAALRARHRDNRAHRHAARVAVHAEADLAASASAIASASASAALPPAAALHAIDQASRADTAEDRRLIATHAAAAAALADQLAALDRRRAGLVHQRAELSRALWVQLHDGYLVCNARGERRALRDLFAPGEPAGGAGDCAAPKLLGHAYRLGATPLALAELWWGAPPAAGGRIAGEFYPACRGKCGPLLPFMLDGLAHAAPPQFATVAPADEPRVVHDDPWLVVVDKPCGMLSVPGRDPALHDSAITRLRARWPSALAVHRLDLDASGLLVAAKDPATHTALQRAFARREVDKRYAAWLDGTIAADRGTVELALRVDLDDRPRQLVDPVHGKPALTEWRVVERRGGRTRVDLVPRTGRSHQLRVHAAHPLGIGAPIVGDRLYGRPAARLALHAEALAFLHPHTGRPIRLACPAPF